MSYLVWEEAVSRVGAGAIAAGAPGAARLHPSPWQFVGKPSWQRGDYTAGHFLQPLPWACHHGYCSPARGEVEVGRVLFSQI